MYLLHVSPRLLLFIQSQLMSILHTDPSIPETLDRMESYGGGFVAALVVAYRRADTNNKQKILTTWSELFTEYGPNSVFASHTTDIMSMGYSMVKHLSIRK